MAIEIIRRDHFKGGRLLATNDDNPQVRELGDIIIEIQEAINAGAAGGETNVGENSGTAGIGWYIGKSGVNLQFKNIVAASGDRIILTDTGAPNYTVQVDVDQSNLALASLGERAYSSLTSRPGDDDFHNNLSIIAEASENADEILGYNVSTGQYVRITKSNLLSGVATEEVVISDDDTTPGFIEDKFIAGTNVALTVLNPGGNEQLQISATGGDIPCGTTGFVDLADSTIAFDEGTLEFSIQPSGVDYSYYINGTQYTRAVTDSITVDDTDGEHFIYFDGTTLSQATVFDSDMYRGKLMVARILWDATNKEAIIYQDDRHSYDLQSAAHVALHLHLGVAYENGMALQNIITESAGDLDSHAQMAVQDGVAWDENMEISLANGSPQTLNPIATIPVLYRVGATGEWRQDAPTNFPIKNYSGGGGRVAYNELLGGIWQQTEIPSTNHCIIPIFLTRDETYPVKAVQGQEQWGTIGLAQGAAQAVYDNFDFTGLPLAEMLLLGVLIVQTANGYTNTTMSRFRDALDGYSYEDFRQKTLEPSIATNFAPPTLSGAGNPNGTLEGELGQVYYDTVNEIWYRCNDAGGTSWDVAS